MTFFQRFITFLRESKIELKKVTWPSRQETIRYTVMVIAVSGVGAIFLGGLDTLFQYLLETFVF